MSYSLQKFFATLVCIIGIIMSVAKIDAGVYLLIIGGVWFVLVRIFGDTVK